MMGQPVGGFTIYMSFISNSYLFFTVSAKFCLRQEQARLLNFSFCQTLMARFK
jgi:hypothetical protein